MDQKSFLASPSCNDESWCRVQEDPSALAPESSFTMSPRSTTLSLYFWNHQCSKVDFPFLFICFQNNIFPALHFVQFPRWQVFELLHSLSTAAFATRIFIACDSGINLCTKLQWLTELNPFSAMWSSWILGRGDSRRFLVDSWDDSGWEKKERRKKKRRTRRQKQVQSHAQELFVIRVRGNPLLRLFSYNTSRFVCGHVNILQWNWECFFTRHVDVNSRSDVMTTSEVSFNRPEVVAGFGVVFCFCWLRSIRVSMNFSSEIDLDSLQDDIALGLILGPRDLFHTILLFRLRTGIWHVQRTEKEQDNNNKERRRRSKKKNIWENGKYTEFWNLPPDEKVHLSWERRRARLSGVHWEDLEYDLNSLREHYSLCWLVLLDVCSAPREMKRHRCATKIAPSVSQLMRTSRRTQRAQGTKTAGSVWQEAWRNERRQEAEKRKNEQEGARSKWVVIKSTR